MSCSHEVAIPGWNPPVKKMKKNKKYFQYITILMGLFLLLVFFLAKLNFGEYIVLVFWFGLCVRNIYGYFYDGRMFAFGSSDVLKGENDDESRVIVLYVTLIAYFVFLLIALFTYY